MDIVGYNDQCSGTLAASKARMASYKRKPVKFDYNFISISIYVCMYGGNLKHKITNICIPYGYN